MIEQPISRAITANGAAAVAFPKIAEHVDGFWEQEEGTASGPSSINILDLNDDFWAMSIGPSGSAECPTVFVPSENQFRQYVPSKGRYERISESAVVGSIISNLELCAGFLPAHTKPSSFVVLKNRQRLKNVAERARDLLKVEDDYFLDRKHLHVACTNGVLQIDNNAFTPSAPNIPVRDPLPVKYDPDAKCELFLGAFLAHILSPEDIDLLQRYLSQLLEGINHSQTILVLTGESGWGKSSLMKILGSLIGWNRLGIVREQLYKDEFELSNYANKHLLYHPDMPTDFLQRKEGSLFKQLVGGDPLWGNIKGDDGRIILHGHFPIVLACNGKPKIHLDEDSDAWLRRLVVLSFKKPDHEKHYGKLAELILQKEASGILNWLLKGRTKLANNKLQLVQTQEQKGRAATLLLASDSPAAFVRSSLVKKKDGELGVADLYEHYLDWCQENQIRPVASRPFTLTAKETIETGLGIRYRHDLDSKNGKTKRGWKGLALVERPVPEKSENTSTGSV